MSKIGFGGGNRYGKPRRMVPDPAHKGDLSMGKMTSKDKSVAAKIGNRLAASRDTGGKLSNKDKKIATDVVIEALNPGKSMDVTEMAMGGYMADEVAEKAMGGYMNNYKDK